MAGPAKKATKKFEKKHLKDTLERRRDFAKVKQRHKNKEKKQARREDVKKLEEEENAKDTSKKDVGEDKFASMNVDDFFAGGFEIPETPAAAPAKKDVKQKIGKRKRTGEEKKEEEEESEGSGSEESEAEGSDAAGSEASGSEDEGDVNAHINQLEALKEKDP
ncbi:Nucleolar Complex 2 protein, partial [Ascosphaera atra]